MVGEDQPIVREGIVHVLQDSGFEVVGTAENARDLVRITRAQRPDVVVTDIQMPPDNTDDGLRAALEIRATVPSVGVLVLSQFLEDRYAMDLVADSAEGVGYLLKENISDLRMFTEAVRRVASGGSALDPNCGCTPRRPKAQGGAARQPDAARAGRARPGRRRPLQRRSGTRTRGQCGSGRAPRDGHLRQARTSPVTRTAPPRSRRPEVSSGLDIGHFHRQHGRPLRADSFLPSRSRLPGEELVKMGGRQLVFRHEHRRTAVFHHLGGNPIDFG